MIETVTLQNGLIVSFDRRCMWARSYLTAGSPYERLNILLCSMFAQDGVFIDVGANIGLFSLHVAKTARHVWSFEPVQSTHALLERNIAANNLTNVTICRTALSREKGECTIAVTSSNLYAHIDGGGKNLEVIQRDTLDSFVFDDVACVKIDVEGHAYAVLEGAQQTLARCHPTIVFEHDHKWLKRAKVSPDAPFNLLRDLGYDTFLNQFFEPFHVRPTNNVYAMKGRPKFAHPEPWANKRTPYKLKGLLDE